MKVLSLVADQGGCAFYRMKEPARIARMLGVDVTIDTNINVHATTDPATKITTVNEVYSDADLIIIQRPLNNAFASMVKQANRQGIATIVELDDDFEMLHRNNMAWDATFNTKGYGPEWIKAAAEEADLFTVSTPALSRYVRHDRVEVLRNSLPASIFDNTPAYERERDTDLPVIGWTGTIQTHPGDLEMTRGALRTLSGVDEEAKAAAECRTVDISTKFHLHIVGDGGGVLNALNLPQTQSHHFTGWLDMKDYYDAIASMDIGIVPLELSPFNQAKSALKGMEMAAMGVPFIASPTQEYERLALYGVGKTASGPSAWTKQLSRLIERPKERIKLAKQYRETVYNEMVYERTAHGWIRAWEKAIAHRKSLS
jgi:glycosyltransferase involved in cell wall biosynthesis